MAQGETTARLRQIGHPAPRAMDTGVPAWRDWVKSGSRRRTVGTRPRLLAPVYPLVALIAAGPRAFIPPEFGIPRLSRLYASVHLGVGVSVCLAAWVGVGRRCAWGVG